MRSDLDFEKYSGDAGLMWHMGWASQTIAKWTKEFGTIEAEWMCRTTDWNEAALVVLSTAWGR